MSLDVEELDTRQIQQLALQTQDKTLDSTARTRQIVEETIQVRIDAW